MVFRSDLLSVFFFDFWWIESTSWVYMYFCFSPLVIAPQTISTLVFWFNCFVSAVLFQYMYCQWQRNDCQSMWLIYCHFVCDVSGWLVRWLVGWLVGWLVVWLVVWLVGWLVRSLVGWLVRWVIFLLGLIRFSRTNYCVSDLYNFSTCIM